MRGTKSWRDVRLYTIGHSTRTFEELVALLQAFGVSILADIRTIPRSRHNPQFNGAALGWALRSRHLRYVHLAELGGLRRVRRDSPNAGWRNASFRGFADYMLTDDFDAGLAKLRGLTTEGTVALMCAEAVPWRCHRSLVADALTVRGARVEHITSPTRSSPHQLTSFAHVEGTRVTYPADGGEPLDTRAPFHLEATVRVLQRRPTNPVDVLVQGSYRRLLTTTDGLALAEVANQGTIDRPDLRIRALRGDISADTFDTIRRTMRKVLGLDLDPRPLQRLVEAERRLHPTAIALRGMRPPRFVGLFETFANVVPFQQVSLDAGIAAVSHLVERFGASLVHDGRRYHAFPEARVLAKARLETIKACGLSAKKAEALRLLARAIEAGDVSVEKLSDMSSDEAMRLLTQLQGIGPWSAGMILLRGLGRLDIFPVGDVGAARSLGGLTHLPPGPLLDRLIRRFGDCCGYLYFCALGGALLAKGHIHADPARSLGKAGLKPA